MIPFDRHAARHLRAPNNFKDQGVVYIRQFRELGKTFADVSPQTEETLSVQKWRRGAGIKKVG